MNQKTILSILGITLLFIGCQSTKTTTQSIPDFIQEDHASTAYHFPQGTYYHYEFSGENMYDFDEKAVISKLLADKIIPQDVWYKPGSSNCSPPGSDMAMTVIVSPSLIIRFDKTNDKINAYGFTAADEPSTGDCAYYVRHYSFK